MRLTNITLPEDGSDPIMSFDLPDGTTLVCTPLELERVLCRISCDPSLRTGHEEYPIKKVRKIGEALFHLDSRFSDDLLKVLLTHTDQEPGNPRKIIQK